MKHIVVTGSMAFDYIMDFPGSYTEHILPDKIKTLSVSFLVNTLNKNFGGTAGNIAYTLALLKKTPILLSSAGLQDFGTYKIHLKTHGVDVSHVNEVPDEFTANAFMMTDKNNCQIAGFYPGAMSQDDSLTLPQDADFLIISPTSSPAIEKFAKEAKKQNLPFLFSPAQGITRLTDQQLTEGIEGSEILIVNDYELALITDRLKLTKKNLLTKTKILITTLGEKGSMIETKDALIHIGIAKVNKVVDPTGAGDAYIGGFVAGLATGEPLEACGQMGAVAASYAIEKYGTQNHVFTTNEFHDRYNKSFT